MDTYHVLEMIGEGSFGRVYKGRKKFSGQVVALKFIPKVGRSEKELRSLKREIDIMRGLRHPNIVLLLDSFETEREVVVVTEYAEGELFQILEDDGNLPETQVREIACQLVSALYYLHSHRILHRDMKPQNILLGKGGVVKLCDFGFARAMSVSTLVLTSIKGTPLYMSPELVEEKPYDHTADLWSLGCILYELHTGVPPFYTNSIFQLVQLIVRDPVKWPESMSQGCTSFLKGLLTKDPQKRLSWPDLLEHPFVADGVLDGSSDSPLTVTPSTDQQALKLKQAKEKAAPRCGEGKLLRKARDLRGKGKASKQDFSTSPRVGSGKGDRSDKALLGSAADGSMPSEDWSASSPDIMDKDAVKTSAILSFAKQPQAAKTLEDRMGPISRDYAQEFPSVEVGPRQVLKHQSTDRCSLGSVRLESEDIDSDEEWMHLVQTTNPENQTSVGLDQTILDRLKERLLASRAQLLDGVLEGACGISRPLKVLSNLLAWREDAEESMSVALKMDLPHFLFDMIEEIMGNAAVKQQPWCVAVLGDLMSALLLYWERHYNWEADGKSLEEHAKPFLSILFHLDMAPIIPQAASVLALFVYRGVSVDLRADKFIAAMEASLHSPVEHRVCLPQDWGLWDGLVALLLLSLSEGESCSVSEFLDSRLWQLLWIRVGDALGEMPPNRDFLSLRGLQIFLSLALFIFIREPYSCVPLFSNSNTKSLPTLSCLLTSDCTSERETPTEERLSHPWSDPSPNSLSMMSCHLLCFPFALEVPDETMARILQTYHSCDIVSRLLQLVLVLPLCLLELPLSLLCHLLLYDPGHAVPRFTAAAEACGFFLPPGAQADGGEQGGGETGRAWERTAGGGETGRPWERTASSLLAAFLRSEALSGSAVELISLVSQTARSSLLPPFSALYVDPAPLRAALAHPDDRIRAATCSLLGNLDPLAPGCGPLLLPLFRTMSDQLHDPGLALRRAACRAVGNWLGLVGRAHSRSGSEPVKEGGGSSGVAGETNAGKETASVVPGGRDRARVEQEVGRWAESARETAPVLLPLLRDPDPLIRRHCCAALGNMAAIRGGGASLLQCDAPNALLQIACADSQNAVRQAALASLWLFSQQDLLRQALVSMDIEEKLQHVSQYTSSPCQYNRLMNQLRPQ
ncbi:serine/threonine-protein kinase 36 isoform X2 [Conger conger]|uniref:serine/threonine-protein kinase 36 isoform X2 n=1 Tax=Conger conger TaxID=82655 RepID=UPI002A59BECA|nr:serine/threonine-protein kinase 36 isoform X2 [Conger conger]